MGGTRTTTTVFGVPNTGVGFPPVIFLFVV